MNINIQELPKPKAFLFDWDNTLVDAWGVIHLALNTTLTAMGYAPWTLEESRTKAARSLRTYFPEIFGNKWQEARGIFYEIIDKNHLKNLKPMQGGGELLKALHAQGYFLGIVSNKRGSVLRKEVAHLGWGSYFSPEAIVGSLDTPQDKPDRGPVDFALRTSSIKSGHEVWLVGDTQVDMQCAYAAGCLPVLVAESNIRDKVAPWFPQVYASNLGALKKLLVDSYILKEGK